MNVFWGKMAAGLFAACVTAAGASAQEAAAPAPPTSGTFSAGLSLTDGNSDTTLADAALKVEHKRDRHEWLFGASMAYGEKDGETSVDNSRGQASYRCLWSERSFGYGSTTALRDDIADVDYRVVVSAGAGYTFVRTPAWDLSGEFGPAEIIEKVGGVRDEILALRAAERLEWVPAEGAKFWQTAEYLPKADDFEDYLLQAEIGAEAPLAGRLLLRLLVRDTYDSMPAPGKEKNDVSLIAGVAVGFRDLLRFPDGEMHLGGLAESGHERAAPVHAVRRPRLGPSGIPFEPGARVAESRLEVPRRIASPDARAHDGARRQGPGAHIPGFRPRPPGVIRSDEEPHPHFRRLHLHRRGHGDAVLADVPEEAHKPPVAAAAGRVGRRFQRVEEGQGLDLHRAGRRARIHRIRAVCGATQRPSRRAGEDESVHDTGSFQRDSLRHLRRPCKCGALIYIAAGLHPARGGAMMDAGGKP
jgi:putative salt-induced outer membrane protein YdiY